MDIAEGQSYKSKSGYTYTVIRVDPKANSVAYTAPPLSQVITAALDIFQAWIIE